jgi:hypothetical protein
MLRIVVIYLPGSNTPRSVPTDTTQASGARAKGFRSTIMMAVLDETIGIAIGGGNITLTGVSCATQRRRGRKPRL